MKKKYLYDLIYVPYSFRTIGSNTVKIADSDIRNSSNIGNTTMLAINVIVKLSMLLQNVIIKRVTDKLSKDLYLAIINL